MENQPAQDAVEAEPSTPTVTSTSSSAADKAREAKLAVSSQQDKLDKAAAELVLQKAMADQKLAVADALARHAKTVSGATEQKSRAEADLEEAKKSEVSAKEKLGSAQEFAREKEADHGNASKRESEARERLDTAQLEFDQAVDAVKDAKKSARTAQAEVVEREAKLAKAQAKVTAAKAASEQAAVKCEAVCLRADAQKEHDVAAAEMALAKARSDDHNALADIEKRSGSSEEAENQG